MKKVLLVDASPRKNGNSEVIVDTIAADLKDAEVILFKMREKKFNPCYACTACQGKEYAKCVQKDDLSDLLEVMDQCDAIVLATPIYFHQICSQAKLFFDRLYPFFHVDKKNMSNTSKFGKKGALVCSFWGGPADVYEKYSEETAKNFAFIGADETRSLIFGNIPNCGDVQSHDDYMKKVHELAKWLVE